MGDWGLGIGDWAQSPIPNPQSPIPNPHLNVYYIIFNFNQIKYKIISYKQLFICFFKIIIKNVGSKQKNYTER